MNQGNAFLSILSTMVFLGASVCSAGRGEHSSSSRLGSHEVAEESSLDRVVHILGSHSCGGCHRGETAQTSMAYFTVDFGRTELLKSLAYRHYGLRNRVLAELGPQALSAYPYLETPSIDPASPDLASLERILVRFELDGDSISPEEREAIRRWVREGAPLPPSIMEETFQEIKAYLRLGGY